MEYGKFINGAVYPASGSYTIGNIAAELDAKPELAILMDYKRIVRTEPPEVADGEALRESWEETSDEIRQMWEKVEIQPETKAGAEVGENDSDN